MPVFTQCFSIKSSTRAEFLNGCHDHATFRAETFRLSFSPACVGTTGASASCCDCRSLEICHTSRDIPSGFFSAVVFCFFAPPPPPAAPLIPIMSLMSIATTRCVEARRRRASRF